MGFLTRCTNFFIEIVIEKEIFEEWNSNSPYQRSAFFDLGYDPWFLYASVSLSRKWDSELMFKLLSNEIFIILGFAKIKISVKKHQTMCTERSQNVLKLLISKSNAHSHSKAP